MVENKRKSGCIQIGELAERLSKNGESLRISAINHLKNLVGSVDMKDCGLFIFGSGTTTGSFLPGSDIDLIIVGNRGFALAGQMENEWTDHPWFPKLDITVVTNTTCPDPYLRASEWIGGDRSILNCIKEKLNNTASKRIHTMEAWCESISALRSLNPDKPLKIKTHPFGLRANWMLRFMSDGSPLYENCNPVQPEGLVTQSSFFRELRILDWIWKVYNGSVDVRHIDVDDFTDSLSKIGNWYAALAAGSMNKIKHCWNSRIHKSSIMAGIDTKSLIGVLDESIIIRQQAARLNGDVAVLLSWCEAEQNVLESIFTYGKDHPLICMGLAFNRNTPASVVIELLTHLKWSESRPLLRRRCYTHKSVKQLPDKEKYSFLANAIKYEPLPKLRRFLYNSMTPLVEIEGAGK